MSNAILNPGDFVTYNCKQVKVRLADYTDVLVCYDDNQFDEMIADFSTRLGLYQVMDNLFLVKNSPVAIVGRFGIGAPAAVARCEELIACGLRRLISLGTAATLVDDIHLGDVIICQKAYSDEGTSRHYFPRQKMYRATSKLVEAVHVHLNGSGLPCRLGATWTTDAPYRETPEKRTKFVAKGAGVVEMETSALYMVAAYRGVEALSVVVVGDSIAGATWRPHFHDPAIRTTLRRTGRALLAWLRAEADIF
jgi:purine-nucleoside phosphorylase